MSRINLTLEEIRDLLFHLPVLEGKETARHQIADMMMHLSGADDWFPEPLHRALINLQTSGVISELQRHAVEKAFFPEHTW